MNSYLVFKLRTAPETKLDFRTVGHEQTLKLAIASKMHTYGSAINILSQQTVSASVGLCMCVWVREGWLVSVLEKHGTVVSSPSGCLCRVAAVRVES